jgi:NDP-4-keto-2,6-dideoxyhexose 3-C-methyltransferase
MAGSWVPILSEEQMRKEKPKYAVVLPWSFKKEFVQRERKIREAGTTLVFPLPSPEFVF